MESIGGEAGRPLVPAGLFSRWLMRLSKPKFIGVVLGVDLAIFALTAIVSTAFFPVEGGARLWVSALGIVVLGIAFLQRLWGYTLSALGRFPRQVRSVVLAVGGGFVAVGGAHFLIGADLMGLRGWLMGWLALAIAALVSFRLIISLAVREAEASGQLARRAVIVGGGKASEDLVARLEKAGQNAISILGIFDDRGGERSPDQVGRYFKIGAFDELERYCRVNSVDLLIIALPASAEDRILHLLRKLWVLPVDVRIAAHNSRLKLSKRAYSYIGDVPFLAVFDRPLSDWNAAVKAIFDRVVAAIALVLLAPVMAGVALAVKFDSKGPVLFRQPRHGFNNEMIGVFKFRSMYTDMTDVQAAKLATRDDPRITRVGRFIRRTSLDELPQLFNVLRGELSLVGPRPHAEKALAGAKLYQDVVDGYYARHRMKPGITGWAQVNGWRGGTDTEEKLERRVEHDLHYIENWSVWLDIVILAMTPVSLITTKDAY